MKATPHSILATTCFIVLTTLAHAGPPSVAGKIESLLKTNNPGEHVFVRKAGNAIVIEQGTMGKNLEIQVPYTHVTYGLSYNLGSGGDTLWQVSINSTAGSTITIHQNDQQHQNTSVWQSFHSRAAADEFITLMQALKDE